MNEDKASTASPGQEAGDEQRRIGGFPTLSLQKSIAMMQKVWDKEKRNPAPATTILEHWEYATKSSGGFQALATLKRFGLLEEVPGATTRSLKVSPMALELLKAENTDPAAYRKQLQFLALLPDWFAEIWKKYGRELPSDKTLEAFLVFDRHLTEESAKLFIKVYKETISFAKLTESDTVEETKLTGGEVDGGKKLNKTSADTPNKLKTNDLGMEINTGELPIPIAGGMARIPFPMTEDDFELFIGTLQLWKKKLVRTLNVIPPAIPLPKNAMWKNGDSNKPVKLVALMGEQNGERYFQSDDGTGIPESQLVF